MARISKYVFNPDTLQYERSFVPRRIWMRRSLLLFLASIALSLLYLFLYTDVFQLTLPKTALLLKQNEAWHARTEVLSHRMDACGETLEALRLRDDGVYRSIFGMNEIPPQTREEGFPGAKRYDDIHRADRDGLLSATARKIDVLLKKAYIQSKSFDDVQALAAQAGDIASCIPTVMPFMPGTPFRISSSFGYRTDPHHHYTKMHTGVDFAMASGTEIYAVGDGVVQTVRYEIFGYGTSAIIDHGYGYKTRYAHMSMLNIVPGMKVHRGDCIGLSGNSGKSTGPHLHYEVMYRGRHVNPMNYLDLNIPKEEYAQMVQARQEEGGTAFLHPSHRDRGKNRKKK